MTENGAYCRYRVLYLLTYWPHVPVLLSYQNPSCLTGKNAAKMLWIWVEFIDVGTWWWHCWGGQGRAEERPGSYWDNSLPGLCDPLCGHSCQDIPEKRVAHEAATNHLAAHCEVDQRVCLPINLGLCYCTALCAFRLQLKNQCEDRIHPSKGPVMCERQWARAQPACDYLLFQLFPRLPPVSGRESGVYVHVCVGLEVGSRGGHWSEMETFWVLGRKRVAKRELQRNCMSVSVCEQFKWECLLFLLRVSLFAQGKHCGQRRCLIQYMLFLSGSYRHRGRWSPVCACPHTITPIGLAALHIDWSASQTQSHKGWPRFQHMHTQAGCKEKYNTRVNMRK